MSLSSLGTGFSRLTALTALKLGGCRGLWVDHSTAAPEGGVASQQQQEGSAAAGGAAASGTTAHSARLARSLLPAVLTMHPLPHEQQLQLLSELAPLSRLRQLLLTDVRALRVLPTCLGRLRGLQHLDASGCSIQFLTEELWAASGLTQLRLHDNVLSELPEDVGQLQQLQVCW
jgi:Leucine-rich repeat (LRR) protein